MPGEQKGKPHKKGAGRPRFGAEKLKRVHLQLSDADVAYLRALRPDRNVSAAVRDVVARDRKTNAESQSAQQGAEQ